MRDRLIALWMMLFSIAPVFAQTSINFSTPGVRISINVPVYPTLQRVPGYPVYYAPSLRSNYFFYDGLYWVYEEDNWYSSSWYNGPWWSVDSMEVPYYVLRVPVRYYRHAPSYFRGWAMNDAPRWGDHWGSSWQQRRGDWNRWDRSRSPSPAPLPNYQRQYSGRQYPQGAQQATIQTRDYRYQPSEPIAQQQFQRQRSQAQANTPRAIDQRGNDPRANRMPTQRSEVQPAPGNVEQPSRTQQSRSQQSPGNRSEPGTREPQPPQTGREQPPRQPNRANDRPDRDQGNDNGRGKGNDGEKGNERDRKDRDR